MQPIHELFRLARRIHAIYEKQHSDYQKAQCAHWILLKRYFEQAQVQRRLAEKAQARGWQLAAIEVQRNLRSVLRACGEAVEAMREQTMASTQAIPSLNDLLSELQRLFDEFDEVRLDWKKTFLAVQTAPIVLKGIKLGRFSLRLHWPSLAHRADVECFEIVPLDPNTAKSNDDVPHPHVKSRVLCAGDATLPLQKALQQGRLIDAFCLLRSVLETYNPGSAHVSLDGWGGIACWSCSAMADEDDSTFCQGCDHDMCMDCMLSCKHCDGMRCSSCMGRCEVCNEPCCRRRLATAADSKRLCCKDCLCVCAECGDKGASDEFDEATGLCSSCQAEAEPPEAEPLECDPPEADIHDDEETVSHPLIGDSS